ncbi:MAG: hypothetical protein ABSF51_12590, partial [Verrucomicrobiota bacterium]
MIIARRVKDRITRLDEILHKLHGIKGRITRAGIEHETEIAVGSPAVQRRIKIAGGILAIFKDPPQIGIELGFHDLTHAVREIESIDQTGGLPALRTGIGIILRAKEFNVCAAGAEVIADLLPSICGVTGPVGCGLEQKRVVVHL